MARALVTGGRYTINELRELLKGKEIKLPEETPKDAKIRSNGGFLVRSMPLEERLTDGFQGEIHFDPTAEQGQVFSKRIVYYPEIDIFIYIGEFLGY